MRNNSVRFGLAIICCLSFFTLSTTTTASAGLLGSFTNEQGSGFNAKPIEAAIGSIYAATGTKELNLTELFVFDTNDSGGGTPSSQYGLSYGVSLDSFNSDNEPLSGSFTDLSDQTIGELTYKALYYTAKMDADKAGSNLYSVMASSNTFSSDFDANGEMEWQFMNREGNLLPQNDPANTWSAPDDPNSIVSKVAISNLRVFGVIERDGVPEPPPQTQVPEPGSLAIFGLGSLLGVGLVRRRRKQNA